MKRKDFASAADSVHSPQQKRLKLTQISPKSPHATRLSDTIQHNYGNNQQDATPMPRRVSLTSPIPPHHQLQLASQITHPDPFHDFQALSNDHINALQQMFNTQIAPNHTLHDAKRPIWSTDHFMTYLAGMNALANQSPSRFPLDPTHRIHYSWLSHSDDALIRKQYLTYIYNCGALNAPDQPTGFKPESLEILRALCLDDDSRVRVEAFRILTSVLREMRKRYRSEAKGEQQLVSSIHMLLSLKHQKQLLRVASKMMDDPYPYVRIRAIELLAELSHMNNDSLEHKSATATDASTASTTKPKPGAPFTDKIFCMLCEKIRDTEVSVRARATELLGSLRNVKSDLLFDTFDKMKLEYSRNKRANSGAGQSSKKKKRRKDKKRTEVKHDAHSDQSAVDTHLEEGHKTEVDLGKTDLNLAYVPDEESLQESLFLDPALGAFVLALEDEYQVVRMAAITSICQLSFTTEQFSKLAIDFVIEMFNDDIDSVRVFAIQTLSKIGAFIRFNEEQLHIALTLLEDASIEIRQSVRDFLSSVRLASATCLQAAFYALSACLKRYPQDEHTIFVSLKFLGQNHPDLTELVMEDLLQLDRVILKPRKHVEDPFYVAAMILVCNSVCGKKNAPLESREAEALATATELTEGNYTARGNPSLFTLLPHFVYDQYLEMKKGRHGDLFPNLPARRISPSFIPSVRESSVPGRLTYILDALDQPANNVAERLMESEEKMHGTLSESIRCYIQDQFVGEWHKEFTSQASRATAELNVHNYDHLLDSIAASIKKHLSTSTTTKDSSFFQVQFLRHFAKCTQRFVQLFAHKNVTNKQFGSLSTPFRQHARFCSKCCELIYETYITQHRFLHLPPIIVIQLKLIRFVALMSSIMSGMDAFLQQQPVEALESLRDLVRRRVFALKEELEQLENINATAEQLHTVVQSIRQLDTGLQTVQGVEPQQLTAAEYLRQVYRLSTSQFFPLLTSDMFASPPSPNTFQYCYVKIVSPESKVECPREFLCYIPMKIKVKAESLHAFPQEEIAAKLRVVVELPDSSEQWFQLHPDEEHHENAFFNTEGNHFAHLRSNVNVEMGRWRDGSIIRLRPVMLYDTDFPDEYRVVLGHHMIITWTDFQSVQSSEDADIASYREHFIPLSRRATHLLVHPHI